MDVQNDYVVVWCDSPIGLISSRVDENDDMIIFQKSELPDSVKVPGHTKGIFDILNKRDGTKVGLHAASVNITFGWDFYF